MPRLTEYHNGVAVIKDKRFKEAAEKLAKLENGLEQLETELKLAVEERARCSRENPLQFDAAKGYATGIYNAWKIVKGNVVCHMEGCGSDE